MLLIEAAVLLLIAWEIGRDIWRKRKVRSLLNTAFDFVQRGQKLQALSPQGTYGRKGHTAHSSLQHDKISLRLGIKRLLISWRRVHLKHDGHF